MTTITALRHAIQNRMTTTAPGVARLDDPLDPAPLASDGRIKPYYFLSMGQGVGDELEESVCGDRSLERHEFQVTVVGRNRDQVEAAIAATVAALTGWEPLPGAGPARLVPIGGTVQPDTAFTPPRFYLHLLYTTATP